MAGENDNSSRVRKPRVNITYKVETDSSSADQELPFVVGVVGDFSGNPSGRLDPFKKRKFVQIDHDNFGDVMARMLPGLRLRVENALSQDGSEMLVSLSFKTLDDFSPAAVANQIEPLRRLLTTRERSTASSQEVAQIDALVSRQLSAVLHHEQFQRLEAAWRGLAYLVKTTDEQASENIKIRVLNVSWKDLESDFNRSNEFDQSHFFRLVYSEEFGAPGGEPFGVLLGDFQIRPRPTPGHPFDDVAMLQRISHVAAAAFCPFIASVGAAMFGLERLADLELQPNLARTFEQLDYLKWRAFRDSEDARFVGLVLPRVLTRLPYQDDGTRHDRFRFFEDVSARRHDKYLWGNAVYAFGAVLVRTFAESAWLASIRGVQSGVIGGGVVTGLPVDSFRTDRPGLAPKGSLEMTISDNLEKELSELGFIPLCRCPDTEYSAFYSNSSVQKPNRYDRPEATANARLSSMLQYMFCVSRFAHYVKVLARDKIGGYAAPADFEEFLRNWLVRYVNPDSEASADVKARYPLREADVQVREKPGKPGQLDCIMRLVPHFQLDDMSAGVRLITELIPPRAG